MPEEKKNMLVKINNEIEKLKSLIEKDQEAIKKINELLSKADQRLREETGNYDHWMRVIENLENSLIETRRILQGRVINLQQLQKEYQELLLTSKTEEPILPDILLTREEQELISEKEIKDNKLAEVVLETTAEKWGEVTLGDLSQIIISMKSSSEGESVKEEKYGELISTKSEEDIENTIRSEPVYLQLRNLLVSGLNKVWNNKIEMLTSQEKAIILKIYKHLGSKKNRNIREDRLFRVISAAVRAASQKNRPI